MIQHWFKIIWNRKKQNFLLILEILIAFLVIGVLFIQSTQLYRNYQQPLGFKYDKVWAISFSTKGEGGEWTKNNNEERFKKLLRSLESYDEVEAVAGLDLLPFTYDNWNNSDSIAGEHLSVERSSCTDDFLKVMGLEITRGEWFSEKHNALDYTPVVITERLAKKYFKEENPIGRRVLPLLEEAQRPRYKELMSKGELREERVVGVINAYRKSGKLANLDYFAFRRCVPTDTVMTNMPGNIMVKMKDSGGMSGVFEEKVLKTLAMQEPTWSFNMRPLSKIRDVRFQKTITPMITFGLVAGFLLIMVALGLIGVVWQNITARRPEIGLRRALGAHQGAIFQQIVGELLVLASLSLIGGSLILWQFPLLDLILVRNIPMENFFIGWLLSVLFIYLLTICCGLYPSIMATNVSPTEALHDE